LWETPPGGHAVRAGMDLRAFVLESGSNRGMLQGAGAAAHGCLHGALGILIAQILI